MLTELESLGFYIYNLKINKIWFISIAFLWLNSKKPKLALRGELLIYVCNVSEQSCFQIF